MKKVINSLKAPAPIGPYSQAIMTGNTLYVSGQIPMNVETGKLVEGDIKAETKQVMENLKAILNEANYNFANVIMSTIFVTDMNDFLAVNEIYGSYFEKDFPARATVQVAKLPLNVNVEIAVIAVA